MKVFLRDDIANLDQQDTEPLLLQLPAWRRESALRFRHPAGRIENAAAFLLLQDALCHEYGIRDIPPFDYDANGKPFLSAYPDLYFNLSHCRNAVVCALGDSPVGVDVERIRCVGDSLVRYTMNAAEQEQIHAASSPERMFTRLWTRKEAVLKFTGQGVGNSMHDVLLPDHLLALGIEVRTFEQQDFIFSVATRNGVPLQVITK